MVSNKPQSKHSERNRNNTSQYIEEFYKYSKCSICKSKKPITSIYNHKTHCPVAVNYLNQDKFLEIIEVSEDDYIQNQLPLQDININQINNSKKNNSNNKKKRKQVTPPWRQQPPLIISDDNDNYNEEEIQDNDSNIINEVKQQENQQNIIEINTSRKIKSSKKSNKKKRFQSYQEIPDYNSDMFDSNYQSPIKKIQTEETQESILQNQNNSIQQYKEKKKEEIQIQMPPINPKSIKEKEKNIFDKYLSSNKMEQEQEEEEEEQKNQQHNLNNMFQYQEQKDQETRDFELAMKMQNEIQESSNRYHSDEQLAQELFQQEKMAIEEQEREILRQQQEQLQQYQYQQQQIQNQNSNGNRNRNGQRIYNFQDYNMPPPSINTRSQQGQNRQNNSIHINQNSNNSFNLRSQRDNNNNGLIFEQLQQNARNNRNRQRENGQIIISFENGMGNNNLVQMGRRSFIANQQINQMSDDQLYEHFTQIDQQIHQQNNGLKKQFINQINEIQFIKQENNNNISEEECRCQICFDDYEQNEKIKILPCLHKFHSQCLEKWLKLNGICPICKNNVQQMFEDNQ